MKRDKFSDDIRSLLVLRLRWSSIGFRLSQATHGCFFVERFNALHYRFWPVRAYWRRPAQVDSAVIVTGIDRNRRAQGLQVIDFK